MGLFLAHMLAHPYAAVNFHRTALPHHRRGVLGPAHMRRYIVADADVDGLPGDATAQALVGLQKGLFQTSEFASWLWYGHFGAVS